MAKKHDFKKERDKDEVLAEAQRLAEADFQKRQAAFITEYNKLVEKYDVEVISVPQLVNAGNGMFAVATQLTVQQKPKQENGKG